MSTSDLIMSILAEKPLNLMSWNVTCGAGGTLAGRKAFILKVSGFKHQGAVVIFPNSLYNRANEMCTFYKRNVQKKDFFSRQTKSV